MPAAPCTSPSLASQQPAVALGAGLASIDQGCQGSVTFVPQPLDRAQPRPVTTRDAPLSIVTAAMLISPRSKPAAWPYSLSGGLRSPVSMVKHNS